MIKMDLIGLWLVISVCLYIWYVVSNRFETKTNQLKREVRELEYEVKRLKLEIERYENKKNY